MEYGQPEAGKKWVEKSSAAAPTLLGLAAGVFFSDLMHRGARRPVALSLAALGVAALTPSVVSVVKDKVAGPQTRRGSRKTLEGIRGDSALSEEEFGEDVYLGV